METVTEPDVRASFVNGSRGDVARLHVPDLADQSWADLDFLGWVEPKAPRRAALVAPHAGRLVGVLLRRNAAGPAGRARMCSLCCTVHPGSGVVLMVAPRSGRAGRDGNTTGLDVCADLRCPDYVRGRAAPPVVGGLEETASVERKVERLARNLEGFLRRVLA